MNDETFQTAWLYVTTGTAMVVANGFVLGSLRTDNKRLALKHSVCEQFFLLRFCRGTTVRNSIHQSAETRLCWWYEAGYEPIVAQLPSELLPLENIFLINKLPWYKANEVFLLIILIRYSYPYGNDAQFLRVHQYSL
ncbi:hypothetical protein M0804_005951 [Polistes exclamans]|nr:hypothetical protein M0804_005951 [Polistes exclamans]